MRRDEAREAMVRDREAARYAADRAFRQYDAADPENRLVAGELEARWNCSAAIWMIGRIASPEMLPDIGALPHLICSLRWFGGGGDDEAGEHGDAR